MWNFLKDRKSNEELKKLEKKNGRGRRISEYVDEKCGTF
jgi:hypothetical protein